MWMGVGLWGVGVPVLRRYTIRPGFVRPTDRIRTRTGTRPPNPLYSSPCPYRTLNAFITLFRWSLIPLKERAQEHGWLEIDKGGRSRVQR